MHKHACRNEDVVMKFLVLSLEDGALDWFSYFTPSGIATMKDLDEAFMEIWGEKMDSCHLLTSLNTIKIN